MKWLASSVCSYAGPALLLMSVPPSVASSSSDIVSSFIANAAAADAFSAAAAAATVAAVAGPRENHTSHMFRGQNQVVATFFAVGYLVDLRRSEHARGVRGWVVQEGCEITVSQWFAVGANLTESQTIPLILTLTINVAPARTLKPCLIGSFKH